MIIGLLDNSNSHLLQRLHIFRIFFFLFDIPFLVDQMPISVRHSLPPNPSDFSVRIFMKGRMNVDVPSIDEFHGYMRFLPWI